MRLFTIFKKTPADGYGQIVKPKIRLPILLLVILSGLGPFSMIAVVPLIPAIADSFDTSYGTAQLVLSMYFMIFAVAQLMLGPLSDRFGRKPVLVVALVSYVAGSCACWYAPSIEVTIAGRCLQAVGAAAGQVLTRVVLFDVYGKSRSASLIGYLTIAMVLGPTMAPDIAGFIAKISGWQHMFFLMLLVSLFTLSWLVKSLP